MEQYKQCNECLETKPLTAFTRSKTGRLGVMAKCKPCKARLQLEYLEKNREHVNKQRRERTEYREVKRAKNREYWEQNKDSINARRRADREKKDRANLLRREDRKNNPEKYRQWDLNHREAHYKSNAKRRAIKSNIPQGDMPNDLIQTLIQFYGNSCMNPDCPHDLTDWNILTHDHVIPVSIDGSTHSLWNSQILCRKCNASKGNRSSTDYRNGRILLAVL